MSRARLAVVAIALAALGGVGVAVVVHLSTGPGEDGLALPGMHGQSSWPTGERRAPPFELRDQNDRAVSLPKLRGRPLLLTFLDSHCVEQCPIAGRQLGTMLRRMAPADRPTVLIVSVNPAGDTRANIQHALVSWGLAGPWRPHWLRGRESELAAVWRDYGITVDTTTHTVAHATALYLIDRRGFQRSGYLFPFLPNFVALDLHELARERL